MNKSSSLLILVHNEIDTIENEIVEINKFLINNSNSELVIVQDGSTDGTYEKLNELKVKYNFILNSLKERRGYTQAFIDGVNSCSGNTILFSDSGGKYNFKNIQKFLNMFKLKNLDLLAGYRVKRKDKFLRRFLSFFYSKLCNILFWNNFKDLDCGFKVFKKSKLLLILENYKFTKSLLTSQLFIYFIKKKSNIYQLPIEYLEIKDRKSRGIPMNKILIISILSITNLFKIRLNLNKKSDLN
mgnify:FL=1|jgi:glycosyltransferase involved in cell wall biosynthesis